MSGFNGARCAQSDVPPLDAELPGQSFQLLHGGKTRALEILFVDDAASKVGLREAHAAHTAAFHQTRLEILADNQLGRAAADIDDQLTASLRLRVLHAHKNQTRFFVAGNDFDRVGDDLLRALEELCGVCRLAQRVRADDTDA